MADTRHRGAIVRVIFLEPKRMKETGKKAYGLLVFDEHRQIIARPCMSQDLRDIVTFVQRQKKEGRLGHVNFEPPDGVDSSETKHPRRYEALELNEIYYASSTLRQR